MVHHGTRVRTVVHQMAWYTCTYHGPMVPGTMAIPNTAAILLVASMGYHTTDVYHGTQSTWYTCTVPWYVLDILNILRTYVHVRIELIDMGPHRDLLWRLLWACQIDSCTDQLTTRVDIGKKGPSVDVLPILGNFFRPYLV